MAALALPWSGEWEARFSPASHHHRRMTRVRSAAALHPDKPADSRAPARRTRTIWLRRDHPGPGGL